MAIITRSNPVCQSPDTKSVVQALERIPFKVVIEHFMTDTASLADIVLPATNSFEEDDLYCASWHHYLTYGTQIVEPPGECRPEHSIWYGLADRLGLDAPGRLAPRQHLAPVIESLRPFGVTLERLEVEGALRNPLACEVPYADGRFPTPSGRYEFYSRLAAEHGHDPLPGVESVPGMTCGVMVDEEFPLALLSPQPRHRMHSQFDNLSGEAGPATDRPWARIHPETAALAGVADGDEIEVSSRQGRATTAAKVDDAVRRGVVVIPNGNWLTLGGGVNYLTPALETDMGEQAAYYECACAIRKVR
jgi:anaerobic selenocysteine-containing dehydrogenase